MELIFYLLVVFTVVQRFYELSLSKRNQQKLIMLDFSRCDSGVSYLFMVMVHSTWFIAMTCENLFYNSKVSFFAWLLALALFLVAQSLRLWAIRTLGNQWNVNVMRPNSSSPTAEFVADGPYKFIRHPNYVAVLIEFLVLPILGGALVTSVVWSILNGWILYWRIKDEELWLFKRPGYQTVMGKKPRFIPRIRHEST